MSEARMVIQEFDCTDCGCHVVNFRPDPVPPLCLSCTWIRRHVPAEHQEATRERLGVPLTPEARALAAYRDTSFPERACDHCSQPYRGPAVYCSLACAQADA
jgi:hypothetical protein